MTFGKAGYTLYAHEALTKEFERTARLQTKFDWFTQRTFVENRSRPLLTQGKQGNRRGVYISLEALHTAIDLPKSF